MFAGAGWLWPEDVVTLYAHLREETHMRSRIVRVGNSRGIRLPKPLLEEAGLAEEVEIHAEPGRIVIEPLKRPRADWAEAARKMAQRDEDRLLDPETATQFEEEDWTW